MTIISSVQFLCQQGLAVCGHSVNDSSLTQLLNLRSQDVLELKAWLQRTFYRWLSRDIVNELIKIMSHAGLHELIK